MNWAGNWSIVGPPNVLQSWRAGKTALRMSVKAISCPKVSRKRKNAEIQIQQTFSPQCKMRARYSWLYRKHIPQRNDFDWFHIIFHWFTLFVYAMTELDWESTYRKRLKITKKGNGKEIQFTKQGDGNSV